MERLISTAAVSGYRSVVDTFCRFLTNPYDVERRRRAAETLMGKTISLGFPDNWFLIGGSGKDSWDAYLARAQEFLCCDEALIPLGFCGRLDPKDDTRVLRSRGDLLLLSGEFGRFYVYSSHNDTLYLVARDLEEFARYGVTRNVFAYEECGECLSPSDISYVKWVASDNLSNGVKDKEVLIVFSNQKDSEDVVSIAYTRFITKGYVELKTPGYGTSALFLANDPDDVRRMWPFRGMSDIMFKITWKTITDRLCCPWALLGVLGYRSAEGDMFEFIAQQVLVVDCFGSVHALILYTKAAFIRRVADSISNLFRHGMIKRIFMGNEFRDRSNRNRQLEGGARCPHRPEYRIQNVREHYIRDASFSGNMSHYHAWLFQATKGSGNFEPWDLKDPNVMPRLFKTDAEPRNPVEDYEENLKAAVSKLKLLDTKKTQLTPADEAMRPYVYRLSYVPKVYMQDKASSFSREACHEERCCNLGYHPVLVYPYERRPAPDQ
uniref:Protein m141 n=1 Tax=Mastomys natalensis cytomegalovirus 2 TaxID=2973540 RepID=A0A9Y1ILH2_9BETA|nr:protein m141 [Mastomys natalensis cytomegalovirus 2]WEG69267.1 protein m141 [Mastomys natalensis cytomegalovirus 2]WEG69406.1 protein m141 [Mastomys natalensis cytomegalovirus 2]WEG69544.1 protein m141 [Mastomys natalensis cytomegalovirus 2]WEG69682.1 protein m141 [Mastomys natalensis cytomegalovirus 2]